MAITRVDAVIDALLATLRADPALAGVTISDGYPVTDDPLDEVVTVGFSWDPEDDRAAEVEQAYHELGTAARRDETLDVFCAVRVSDGGGDMATARARCVVLLGAVESALRAAPALGLADLLRAEVTVGDYRQAQDADGAAALLRFTVTATSLI